MHLYTLTILLLISGQLFSQKNSDIAISKHTLDSLKTEIHFLRSQNNNLYWKYRVATEVQKMDTAFYSADSAIIRYLTKEGNLVKKQRLSFDKTGCKKHSTDYYFDKNTLVKYVEYWDFNCSKAEDNDPNDYTITDYLGRYDRLEYDSLGRLILQVINLSTPVTLRIEYRHSEEGERKGSSRRIKWNEFWDK
jgi:hypothetical protein